MCIVNVEIIAERNWEVVKMLAMENENCGCLQCLGGAVAGSRDVDFWDALKSDIRFM